MLDQWGKPFFTIPAIPFSLLGIQGLYFFNIACILLSGWLLYATARKLGMRLPWMAAAFFLFQPVVFGNVISGLTEPVNALALSYVFYLFAGQRYTSGTIVASLLPYFRSEGFVLLVAVLIFLLARKKWKQIPFLITGTILFVLITGIATGNWTAVIDQNPYLKFESGGQFDPGHGDLLHYVHNYQGITGLVISFLMLAAFILLAAHVVYLLRRRTPEEKSRFAFWLLAPVYLSFFLAHSFLWWTGSMGSHGLIRVFLVVAPAASLLALYAFDKFLGIELAFVNKILPIALLTYAVVLCYAGNRFPYPWHNEPVIREYPAQANIDKALQFIRDHHLDGKPVVHQLPSVSAQNGWDPWGKEETYELWSLDKRPGKDWLPDSCIVLWDGWHAVRDTPMPLDTMKSLPEYAEIAHFPHEDSIYEVRLFLKSKAGSTRQVPVAD